MGEEITINFSVLIKTLWKEKLRILLITILIAAIGILYSKLARKEYISEGKILPELQSRTNNFSQFAGLPSLAGIDLNSFSGSGFDAVRPDLYPNIITSTDFYLSLFLQNVTTKDNKKMGFEEFYHAFIEDNKKPTERFLTKYNINNNNVRILRLLDEIRLKDLKNRITANIDKKSGIISISVKMPDPVVSAEIANYAMQYLMKYVKEYRTEKLKNDVEYLYNQVIDSRSKYYTNQEKKAKYSDQFKDIMLQSADVQRERIDAEYKLSSTFYNELLKKYEEAKFKLHQETPVFKVLEPPVAPVKKAEPKTLVILVLAIFCGFGISIIYILMRENHFKQIIQF